MPHAGFYPQPSPKWLHVSPVPGSLAAHLGGSHSNLAYDHLSISPGPAFTGSPRPQVPRAARPSGWCLHTRPPAPPLKPPCSPVSRDQSFQGCRAMAEQKARILTRDWPQFSLHHVMPWLCVLILQTPMPAPPEQVLPTPNLSGPQLPHGHKQGDGGPGSVAPRDSHVLGMPHQPRSEGHAPVLCPRSHSQELGAQLEQTLHNQHVVPHGRPPTSALRTRKRGLA